MSNIPLAPKHLKGVTPTITHYEDLEVAVGYAITCAVVRKETKVKVFHTDQDMLYKMAEDLKTKDYTALVSNVPANGNRYSLTIIW